MRLPSENENRLKSAAWCLLVLAGWMLSVQAQWATAFFGLDPSWRAVLQWAAVQGKMFGRDIVFTYGPCGFLLSTEFNGDILWPAVFTAQHVLRFAMWLSVLMPTRRLPIRQQALLAVVFLVLLIILDPNFDFMFAAGMTGLALAFILERDRHTRLLMAIFGGILWGMLALVKTTLLLHASALSAIILFAGARSGKTFAAMLWNGTAVLTAVVLWTTLCGPLYPFFQWLHTSLWISRGYQNTMGIETPRPVLVCLACLLAWIVYRLIVSICPVRRRVPERIRHRRRIEPAAILAVMTFLVWKHGILRSDSAHYSFFLAAAVMILLWLTLLPVFLPPAKRLHTAATIALLAWAAACLFGFLTGSTLSLKTFLMERENSLRGFISFVMHPRQNIRCARERFDTARLSHELPAAKSAIGKSSVDVFGANQLSALLNGLNYNPRPVFQSYLAFSPELNALNRDYYERHAPERILFQMTPIDNRFPAMEDASVLLMSLNSYSPVLAESGFICLRKLEAKGATEPAVTKKESVRAGWNERISLPAAGADEPGVSVITASIACAPNFLGQCMNIFYKLPPLKLVIGYRNEDGSDRQLEFNMPFSLGETPFLISPLVMSESDVILFSLRPDQLIRPEWFMLQPGGAGKALRQPTPVAITHRVCRIPGKAPESLLGVMFPSFKTFPSSWTREYCVPAEERGKPVQLLHAPAAMIFKCPGRTPFLLTGSFGIKDAAWQQGRTDGVIFRISMESGGGRQTLYKKELNPLSNPDDRGSHAMQIVVESCPPEGGTLKLETMPGENNLWDWAYWADIEITPD